MWYKVVIRRDGTVASCNEVSESFEDGASVFYVECDSKSDAITIAKKRKLDKKYATVRKLKELGLCGDCRRPARPGKTRCADCAEKKATYRINARNGTFVPKNHDELSAVHKGRPRHSTERLLTLLVCQRNYEAMTAAQYRAWLKREIDLKRSAAQPVAAE